MKQSFTFLRVHLDRTRRMVMSASAGGDWALSQPEAVRSNMRNFWFDGFFFSASDNIVLTYLVLYLLSLGAEKAQIGVLSSLSSLSAALLLLPGAMLVERIGHRKLIALLGGGGVGRLALLFLALLPFLGSGPLLVSLAIAFAVLRDAASNLSYPAWMAITGDIIPVGGRGRYFASRNFAMGLSGIVVTLIAGQLITRANSIGSYQVALIVAFVLGCVSTVFFGRLKDTPQAALPAQTASLSPRAIWHDLLSYPAFFWLCATAALWNFSLNIAGPFFTVYLVQNLKATAAMVAVTTTATMVSSLLAQRKLGELSDRWGSRRLQLVSGLLIPILPILWIFASASWHVIPINLFGGLIWATFNLASFNFLLALTPVHQRARFAAIYQVLVMLSLSAGAAVGGLIVTHLGYQTIFFLSGLGRIIATLMFARYVHEPKAVLQPVITPAIEAAPDLAD